MKAEIGVGAGTSLADPRTVDAITSFDAVRWVAANSRRPTMIAETAFASGARIGGATNPTAGDEHEDLPAG